MKTNRKEDWIVVLGVILVALIIAIVFLVRNRTPDETEDTPEAVQHPVEYISPISV